MRGGGLESNSSLPGMEAEATKYLKLDTDLLCSSAGSGVGAGRAAFLFSLGFLKLVIC